MVKLIPKMLFNIHLSVFNKIGARVQVGEGVDSEAVRRMKLAPQELTAHVLYFEQLQDVGSRK